MLLYLLNLSSKDSEWRLCWGEREVIRSFQKPLGDYFGFGLIWWGVNTYLYGWNHFAYITIIFSFILKHFSDIRIFIIAYFYNLFCTLIIMCKLFVVSSVFKLGINFLSILLYLLFSHTILMHNEFNFDKDTDFK